MNKKLFTLLGIVSLYAVQQSFAETKLWVGSQESKNASISENWSPVGCPVQGDDILLDSSSDNMIWDLDVTVSNWTQEEGYSGKVTITTEYPEKAEISGSITNLSISNNLTINGGVMTHQPNILSQTYRLAVNVGGDFSLGQNAFIDVRCLGLDSTSTETGRVRGSHGGGWSSAHNAYGNVYEPIDLGTAGPGTTNGSTLNGGGAVYIDVIGDMIVNGQILAGVVTNGYANSKQHYVSPGSGGSVYLKGASLSGSGEINVSPYSKYVTNGTYGDNGSCGGRIGLNLISQTIADFDTQWIGSLDARGVDGSEKGSGGNGTILIRTSDKRDGRLVLWNSYNSSTKYGSQKVHYFRGASILENEIWEFDEIQFKGNGLLVVPQNTTLRLKGLSSVKGTNTTSPNCGIILDGGTIDWGETGDLTFDGNWTLCVLSDYTFNCNVTLASKCAWGYIRELYNTLDSSLLPHFKVNGNLTINEGASLSAEGSYFKYAFSSTSYSPAHGGACGTTYNEEGFSGVYGSVFNPITVGNICKFARGGGAIKLDVTESIFLNGSITADGTFTSSIGGAGGSLDISAREIIIGDAGKITANGGGKYNPKDENYGGCGGRIAIHTKTPIDITNLSKISTDGGLGTKLELSACGYGVPGTIYIDDKDSVVESGDVYIRPKKAYHAYYTAIPSQSRGGENDDWKNVSVEVLEVANCSGGIILTDNLKMEELRLATTAKTNLNGKELRLKSLKIAGVPVPMGTYSASDVLVMNNFIDTSADALGRIIVEGVATVIIVK